MELIHQKPVSRKTPAFRQREETDYFLRIFVLE